MRLFFDSDVLLDLFLDRKPYSQAIYDLLTLTANKDEWFTSVLAGANMFYIIHKNLNKKAAQGTIGKLIQKFNLLDITSNNFIQANEGGFSDFEDGIQYECCLSNDIDYIITRNIKVYKKSSIQVFNAEEMIIHLLK